MSYDLPVGKVVVLSTACWIKATVAHGVALGRKRLEVFTRR